MKSNIKNVYFFVLFLNILACRPDPEAFSESHLGLTCSMGGITAPDSCRADFNGTIDWNSKLNLSDNIINSLRDFEASFEVPDLLIQSMLHLNHTSQSDLDHVRVPVGNSETKFQFYTGKSQEGDLVPESIIEVSEALISSVSKLQCKVLEFFPASQTDLGAQQDMDFGLKSPHSFFGRCEDAPSFGIAIQVAFDSKNKKQFQYEVMFVNIQEAKNGMLTVEPIVKTGIKTRTLASKRKTERL